MLSMVGHPESDTGQRIRSIIPIFEPKEGETGNKLHSILPIFILQQLK
jgi:hypothetical protein